MKTLQRLGFKKARRTGHQFLVHSDKDVEVRIPNKHRCTYDVGSHLFKNILRQAQISLDEYSEAYRGK